MLISDILLAPGSIRASGMTASCHAGIARPLPSRTSPVALQRRFAVAVAADLVAVPPSPAGDGRRGRHRAASTSSRLFAEFLAPFDPDRTSIRATPITRRRRSHLFDTRRGRRAGVPAACQRLQADASIRSALQPTFVDRRRRKKLPDRPLRAGEPYKLWGLVPARTAAHRPAEHGRAVYLLGADRLGRDMLSRIIHGTRISMSIGLVGVAISLLLGIVLGGISGYYGGWVDYVIQRVDRVHPVAADHPALARPRRRAAARLAAATRLLRHHAHPVAGRLDRARARGARPLPVAAHRGLRHRGAARRRVAKRAIIFRHMLPSFASHIIAAVTLAIPAMILAETALSFLGLGLQPPIVSWGVLLQEAQNIRSIATAPWLFAPGVAVVHRRARPQLPRRRPARRRRPLRQ